MATSTMSTSTSKRETSIWITAKNEIHEGARVSLDQLEKLRLTLRQLLHELIVEVRILKNSLSNHTEIRV